MAEHITLMRKSAIVSLDVLAVFVGTLIASPFVLVIVAPFIQGF